MHLEIVSCGNTTLINKIRITNQISKDLIFIFPHPFSSLSPGTISHNALTSYVPCRHQAPPGRNESWRPPSHKFSGKPDQYHGFGTA